MLEGAAADVGTMPTVSMTGVPAEATLPGVLGAALAVATTADDEAEGVKWESLSVWEWRSGGGPEPAVLLLLPLAVLV